MLEDTKVLETRRIKDHIFRKREDEKGGTFWTIEYWLSEDTPPAVKLARTLEEKQKNLADIAENNQHRK